MNNLIYPMPTFHTGQGRAISERKRFTVLQCGRRWGKTYFDTHLIGLRAITKPNQLIAYIAPTHKNFAEVWRELKQNLHQFIKTKNEQSKTLELINGSIIEFWSLENFETIRGRKYHLAILDEVALYSKLEEAWNSVIRATLMDYKGEAWFTSTPRPNYFKTLAENAQKYPEHWATIQAPTHSNPHIDASEIDFFKRELPELIYRQEILAEFVDLAGSIIKREFIQYYDALPSGLKILQGVDLAITQKDTSDYTAIATIGIDADNNVYIIDVEKARLGYREIMQFIISKAEKYNPTAIAVETVAFQSIIADELLRGTRLPIFKETPNKDKLIRFTPLWSKFEAKKVYLSKHLPSYVEAELLEFPVSKHDDVIDALSYAYSQMKNPISKLFVF